MLKQSLEKNTNPVAKITDYPLYTKKANSVPEKKHIFSDGTCSAQAGKNTCRV